MPKVHFVKKALKDNRVCKKGESYYWWRTRLKGQKSGVTRMSKSRPRASQLTRSDFLQAAYSIMEEIEDAKPVDFADLDALLDARDSWVEQINDLKGETEDKLNNMPEGLQQGDTGQLLEERIQALDSWGSELESVDIDPEARPEDGQTAEELLAEKLSELQDVGCDL